MARHEFGVMPLAPEAGQRFEKYEPGKYRCIPVEDDEIERLLPETLGLLRGHKANGTALPIPPDAPDKFWQMLPFPPTGC